MPDTRPTFPTKKVRYPTTKHDINVPAIAYRKIAPILSIKFFLFRLYPASNIIGGNSTKKKNSGDCVYDRSVYIEVMRQESVSETSLVKFDSIIHHARVATCTS